MAHAEMTPIFVGLRTGLHVLFVALVALVIGTAVVNPTDASVAVVVTAIILLATYAAGGIFARASQSGGRGRGPGLLWVAVVTAEWIVLLFLSPIAAYLVFPLFFLYLHILGRLVGTIMVVVTTAVAIVALGIEGGWSFGGVIGPLVGAAVAVMIGLGYQALAREAVERERLMSELLSTRDQLAAADHESGVLAERARLAREIHDTVAQGLSSIQMLLHAAERADPERPGVEHIRLARETAASNLADTRRFISELTPPNLDEAGLGGTLRRLAETQWTPQGLVVNVRISDALTLPMYLQTALLRIAQGAVANIIQHAEASTATITLDVDGDDLRFTIADDGRGFDPDDLSSETGRARTDSFGLQATRERVDQLGGVLTVDSAPGRGTVVTVDLTLKDNA
ncbi:sensor histidine kinase [Leifsonia sp. A12D58]|uniref:sensor histidine kinase n=1 Tax=Leifsonia sp. A12D58 TaxID=3397674 RepID=UPI0039E130CC